MARSQEFTARIAGEAPLLMEGALGERLKREFSLVPDEHIALASMVMSERGREALSSLWGGYLDVAAARNLPFMATTPTRRANRERIAASAYDESVLKANSAFLLHIRETAPVPMYAGGLMGCKGDAYTAEGALTETEAHTFHVWQAARLAASGLDFLFAGIMPALPEAIGMARAMGGTGLPYIISFMILESGTLVDGTPVSEAIAAIDAAVPVKPLCYMANCIHPAVLFKALGAPCNDTGIIRDRFKGLQANAAYLPPDMLDGSETLRNSDPQDLAAHFASLSSLLDMRVYGGCCGTDRSHMEALAALL